MWYNLLVKSISTSNHMFGRAIWVNCPCAFLKIWHCLSKTRTISNFSKIMRVIYPKNYPNQTCDYWMYVLIMSRMRLRTKWLWVRVPLQSLMWLLVNHTKPTNTLYWNWYLLRAGNYKSSSWQLENSRKLQNNTINSTISKTTNHVIHQVI